MECTCRKASSGSLEGSTPIGVEDKATSISLVQEPGWVAEPVRTAICTIACISAIPIVLGSTTQHGGRDSERIRADKSWGEGGAGHGGSTAGVLQGGGTFAPRCSGNTSGCVGDVSAVGTGSNGVANCVADDIVVAVLVRGEDDQLELDVSEEDLGINSQQTSVPWVRLTGISLPKTPHGWSVKTRVLTLPSASVRTRGARLPVIRTKLSWGTTSMFAAAPGR
jgi:hypothetical protein